jgi:hypothetical protein
MDSDFQAPDQVVPSDSSMADTQDIAGSDRCKLHLIDDVAWPRPHTRNTRCEYCDIAKPFDPRLVSATSIFSMRGPPSETWWATMAFLQRAIANSTEIPAARTMPHGQACQRTLTPK